MVLRRSLLLVLVLVTIGGAACGTDRPTQVAAGGDPAATSSTAVPAPDATSTTGAPATTAPTPTTAVAPTTTSTTVAGGSGTAASPVDGLVADQLKAAVEAPLRSGTRSAPGPTADQVSLPDGTRVWRVRVPGTFPARSARVAVFVGDRRIGDGVLAADLQALTAVTTDGTGLTAGRPVTIQWEGGSKQSAGTLAVIR